MTKQILTLLLFFTVILGFGQELPQSTVSAGISFTSIIRGLLGMIVLIGIALIFSKNRKAVKWRTIGIALILQLLLGIAILKGDAIGFNIGDTRLDLGFVGGFFDAVGQVFINILGYTKAGSEFLLGGLLDSNSYGFIFAFQVLPVIIFFSALTSVLFYLGIIQVVVKAAAAVSSSA